MIPVMLHALLLANENLDEEGQAPGLFVSLTAMVIVIGACAGLLWVLNWLKEKFFPRQDDR